jgi:hypothetical protein
VENRLTMNWKLSVGVMLILIGSVAALAMPPAAASQAKDAAASGPWKKQEPIPTPWHFHDVDMVSVSEGWAVAAPTTGDHATIWHTVNGSTSRSPT